MHEGTVKKAAVAAFLFVGAGFVGWQARWYVYQTRISDALIGLPKRPTVPEIIAVREQLAKDARKLWIVPESVTYDIHVEQHSSNGFATKEDMTEFYWFVVVHARRGSNKADQEQRIDTKLEEPDLKALEAGGIAVKRRSREGS